MTKLKAPDHSNINHGTRRVAPGEVIDVEDRDVESLKSLGWIEAKQPKPKQQPKPKTDKDGDQ